MVHSQHQNLYIDMVEKKLTRHLGRQRLVGNTLIPNLQYRGCHLLQVYGLGSSIALTPRHSVPGGQEERRRVLDS